MFGLVEGMRRNFARKVVQLHMHGLKNAWLIKIMIVRLLQ
jgi:hypothetical protein